MCTKLKLYLLLLSGMALLIFTCSCDNETDEDIISDKPLAAFQKELLDIAFETACAIPVKPHIKNRSKAQEAVIDTCLKLDQPKRALAYTEKIENWRRGLCYADLAFCCAKSGYNNKAQHLLNLATQIAKEDHGQEWRNNRIKAKIAKARFELGQTKEAEKLKTDLANSENDELAQAEAKADTQGSFDEQAYILDGLINTGVYEMIKCALKSYARLFDRFYDDENCRSLAEGKIKSSWDKLPVFLRIELLSDMANFALEHSDQNKALELINEAQIFLDDSQWRPEHQVVYMAKLSEPRYLAGDIERAHTDADAAFSLFNDKKNEIVDICRAEALLPLAQAYQSMGDTETALSVYKQAVEEGVENPNLRPRAEDLSATCCSMALCAVEPDAELWTRIHQVSAELLGQSW